MGVSARSNADGRAARAPRWGIRAAAPLLAIWVFVAAAPALACPGDCDGNGQVTIAELIRSVNIALGNAPVSNCAAADVNGNGTVAVNELIAAVNASLSGCPIEPIFPANYRDTYTIVRDCRFSIEHGGPMIRVWADPSSVQPYLDEDNPLPVGSIIIKEEFLGTDCDTDSELDRWRVMRKEEPGFDAEHGDWAWQWVDADRSVRFNDKTTCIGCHLAPECVARDYMCTEDADPTPTPVPQPGELDLVLQNLPGALLSITGTSPTDVIAVGADPGDGKGPMVLRYDGTSWRRLETGATGDLWWISVTPVDGAFYMAGDGGLVLRFDPVSEEFTRQDTPTGGILYGIWGAAADDLWAVGDAGDGGTAIVLRNTGAGWSEVDVSGVRPQGVPTLFKVWGRSTSEVYAVGGSGVILRYDGEEWSLVPSGTTRTLFTVSGNDSIVAAVGGFISGVVVELDGDEFVDATPANFPQMNGVFVPDEGTPAAGGVSRATGLRESGTWRQVDDGIDTLRDYHAVWVDSEEGIWAVGGDLSAGILDRGVVAYGGPQNVSGVLEP